MMYFLAFFAGCLCGAGCVALFAGAKNLREQAEAAERVPTLWEGQ